MKILLLLIPALLIAGCSPSEVLSPEPSSLDLDNISPSCPGLTSVNVSSGPSLSVTWNEGTDNFSQASKLTYSVFLRAGTNSYDLVSPTKIVVGATTTLITNGIQLGQTYTLFVTCKDEAGNVAPLGPVNEIAVTVADQIAPLAITDLAAGSPTFTSILLTWSPSDDGAGGTTASQMRYRVYSSPTSPVSTLGTPIATLTGVTSFTHAGLTPGSGIRYYRVVAIDLANNVSNDSNQASQQTTSDNVAPVLATPNILATATSANSIDISWTAGSDAVTPVGDLVYDIYRCSGSTTCDPYALSPVLRTGAGVTTYSNSGLASSTVYVYGVRAVDTSGNQSTTTDVLVASTDYTNTGEFFAYPTSTETGTLLGHSVAVANIVGDATGANAFPDLILGAPKASEPGFNFANTGCFYVFPGTAVGVFSTTPTQVVCQFNASANGAGTVYGGNGGTANYQNFGYAMVAADYDLDGDADLIVTSPRQNKMFIYLTVNSGGVLALPSTPQTINSGEVTGGFGYGICLGDSDGVGGPDVFVVDSRANCPDACGVNTTGTVKLFTNSSNGSYDPPAQVVSASAPISPTTALLGAGYLIAQPANSIEHVARSCTVGNFDPDSPTSPILVVGSGVFEHDANPTATNNAWPQNDGIISFYRRTAINQWTYQNNILAVNQNPPGLRDTQWGDSVQALQLNGTLGSGIHELYIGAPNDSSAGTGAGAVYGYSVSTATAGGNFVLSDIGNYYYGGTDQNSNSAGYALAAANIWGHTDSKQDLVVGAPQDDRVLIPSATTLDMGNAFTYRNVSGVLSSVIQQRNFDASSLTAKIDNQFGLGLCGGDINNDGYPDVVMGAPFHDYDDSTFTLATDQGAAFIYYGRPSQEIDVSNPSQIIYGPGNQGAAYFGFACTVMDYNNDGFNDLLVSAPRKTIGIHSNRGAVYIYFGAANTAIPSLNSASLNSPVTGYNVFFGQSLTSGDFDGNGFPDLAVGSYEFDYGGRDTGQAWVFWANDTSGSIMPSTFTTIRPPGGTMGSAFNPNLNNTYPTRNEIPISTISRSGNVTTVNTTVAHGLSTGNYVTVSGTSNTSGTSFDHVAFNTNFNTTASAITVANTTRFTYANTGANVTGVPSTGVVQYFASETTHFGFSVAAFQTVPNSLGTDLIVCQPRFDPLVNHFDSGSAAFTDLGNCYIYEGKINAGLSGSYQISTSPKNEIRFPASENASNTLFFGAGMTVGHWDTDNVKDLVICSTRVRRTPVVTNVGGCFAYLGRATGGFDINNNSYKRHTGATRSTPLHNQVKKNPGTEASTDFGTSVLLIDINDNGRDDLLVGEPLTDNVDDNVYDHPSFLGRDSGRVYINRGEF